MVFGLLQDQRGAIAGRLDVLDEVDGIDTFPDLECDISGLRVGEVGIPSEIGVMLCERGVPESQESLDVPTFDILCLGVDKDREVEVVGHERTLIPGLEHVQPFQDQDVGLVHDPGLIGDCVVGNVGVDGHFEMSLAALDPGDELEQRPPVVTLREALPFQKAAFLENLVWVKKAVRSHEVYPGVIGPASQKRLENTGNGRFANCHRPRHADNEWDRSRGCPQKRIGHGC